jgi:hypothetical protein
LVPVVVVVVVVAGVCGAGRGRGVVVRGEVVGVYAVLSGLTRVSGAMFVFHNFETSASRSMPTST